MLNLKTGLIGCGRIGCFTSDLLKQKLPKGWLPLNHADAIRTVNGLTLDSICDTNESTLLEAGQRLQVSKRYTSSRDLITETKPEVLSIATRTKSRCEIINFAINHGIKAMHIEKPISTNLKECTYTLALAEKNNVKISYGTYRRYMGAYRKAKEIALSGELGEIIEIQVQHGRAYLMWSHPHAADLLNFFSNGADIESIKAVCSIDKHSVSETIVDCDPLVQYIFVKFSNGINGLITCSGGMNTQITCSKGTLTVIGNGSGIILNKVDKSSQQFLPQEDITFSNSKSGTQTAFEELVRSLKTDDYPGISLKEIMQSQTILFGAVASSLNNCEKIIPDDINPDLTVTGRLGELYA